MLVVICLLGLCYLVGYLRCAHKGVLFIFCPPSVAE